jgi:hypothetical protein
MEIKLDNVGSAPMGALDDAHETLDLWHAILLESRLEGAAACPWLGRVAGFSGILETA